MTDSVRVRGVEQVQRSLAQLGDDLDDMSGTTRSAADLIVRAAQGFAPVRTGRLRASITPKVTRAGATVTAGVNIASPYPAVMEFGSRHVTGRRYMRRAADRAQPAVVDQYETAVQTAARKVKGA